MPISAFPQQPEITISFTIYTQAHHKTRRDFHLRNLAGTEAEQIEQARQIMNEVAQEIYHLMGGFGIDKGEIKVGKSKVAEVIYPTLVSKPHTFFFMYGALFKFTPITYYTWVKGQQKTPWLAEDRVSEGWQIEKITRYEEASFRLPCEFISSRHASQQKPEEFVFFWKHFSTGRKRKKSREYLYYDRNDPIFERFIQRFYQDGNLSFGERRYLLPDNAQVQVYECKWPKSRTKPEKQPRRSKLASQPVDNTNYVYLIRMGRTKYYKIGKTNDPQGRLASLQTANPQKLTLLHTFKADNATAAEEDLHAALHYQRRAGEWFQLSDEQKTALVAVTEYKDHHFIKNSQAVKAKELLPNLAVKSPAKARKRLASQDEQFEF